MYSGIRKVSAVAILAGGIGVATAFHHRPAEPETRKPDVSERLVLLAHPEASERAAPSHEAPSPHPPLPDPPPAPSLPQDIARPWEASKPIDPGGPPPSLSRSFPGTEHSSGESPSLPETRIWTPPEPKPATSHKVSDGDTLPSLAHRYLGSEDRASEIYEANRAVLASPDLLPIGIKLTIPPRNAEPQLPPSMPQPPLVPVEDIPAAAPTNQATPDGQLGGTPRT